MKRKRMNKKASKRSFKKNAGTHKRNLTTSLPRGGIRL